MPRRLPEKVITFGTFAAAASSMAARNRFLQPVVILDAIERVRDGPARPLRIHRRRQSVLAQQRPIHGTDQIEALNAQPRGDPAAILETGPASEDALRDALLDASLTFDWLGRLRPSLSRGCNSRCARQELPSLHVSASPERHSIEF